MNTVYIALFLASSYLIGAIPFGWFVVKIIAHKEVREAGSSGKIGATNVNRVVGKDGGKITLLLDGLKGFAIATIALACFGENPWFSFVTGAALLLAVMGHRFSLVLAFFPPPKMLEGKQLSSLRLFLRRFNGGSGVATYLGFIFPISIFCFFEFVHLWTYIGFICLPLGFWAAYKKSQKRMSLSSMFVLTLTTLYFCGLTLLTPFYHYSCLTIFLVGVAYFVIFNHRENIVRAWHKQEPPSDLL